MLTILGLLQVHGHIFIKCSSIKQKFLLSPETQWRGAQVLGAKSLWWLNVVSWHLIFLGPQCGSCFMSSLWCHQFLRGSSIFGKFLHPWINVLSYYTNHCVRMNKWMTNFCINSQVTPQTCFEIVMFFCMVLDLGKEYVQDVGAQASCLLFCTHPFH